jgi:hypothetical protein
MEGEGSLDRAADAAVSDFHPLRDFLTILVDCHWLFDVRCFVTC